jgi:anti-sigma B factor antagonist
MGEEPRGRARARVRQMPDYTLVELYGDIDIASLSEVTPPLERAAREASRMVVDLRAVSFFDCTLLGLLCRTRARVVGRHGRFHLVCDKPRALRILHITDLLKVFAPVPSPAELAVVQSAAQGGARDGAATGQPRPGARSIRYGEAILSRKSCYRA